MPAKYFRSPTQMYRQVSGKVELRTCVGKSVVWREVESLPLDATQFLVTPDPYHSPRKNARTHMKKKQPRVKFEFKGVTFEEHNIERALSCCRFLSGESFETMAQTFECTLHQAEDVAENAFQSLAWNLKLSPEFLLEATTEYSCQKDMAAWSRKK